MSFQEYKEHLKLQKKQLKNYKKGDIFFESAKVQIVESSEGGKKVITTGQTYVK